MSQEYPPPPPATSRVRLLLLATWAALTAAALAFVATLGTNAPNTDEWGFVPAVTGHEPLLPWLWAQHNEHRLPLPRLVYYALFQLTHDYRTGSVLQVVLLSATSLVLMNVAARLRGRPHWADLFFPVSLVHAGHWENLLIGYNLCFALILVLETALGVVALTTTRETLSHTGLTAGVLMVLLCLCGGGGLITAVPVAAWLAYLAGLSASKAPRWQAVALLAFALFPFGYLAVYLVDYHAPAHHPPAESAIDAAAVTGQVLAMSLGFGLAKSWAVVLAGLAVLGLFTLGAILGNVRTFATRPAAVGLLAVAAGVVAVAVVIGVGRAGLDPRPGHVSKAGLASRYAYLTWPLPALAFLFWTTRPTPAAKGVTGVLCLAAAVAYPMNTVAGLQGGTGVRSVLAAVEDDARTGVPPDQIVRRFPGTFQANQEERAVRAIPMLREAGVGAFGEGRP